MNMLSCNVMYHECVRFVMAEVADGVIQGGCQERDCKIDDIDSSKRAKTSKAEKSFIFKNPLGKHSLITVKRKSKPNKPCR